MRTLPKPYPDELLYSVVARTAVRYGYWSPKNLMQAVYGRQSVLAVPDLPSNLAELAAQAHASWQLDVGAIALRHTLVGYYTHFLGVTARDDAIARMASKGGHLQVRLGICAGSAVVPKWFRFCPLCREADLSTLGESFWHRSHHLPGVLVCHVHGVPLLETDVPFRPIGRHEHQAVPLEEASNCPPPLVDDLERPEVAKAIAVRSAQLLDAAARSDETLLDYRQALEDCGFSAGRGSFGRLRSAFEEHFGSAMLKTALRGDACSDHLGWLAEALRLPRRRLHPFKHILLSLFAEANAATCEVKLPVHPPANGRLKTWRIYQSPALRKEAASLGRLGLTTCAVARALDVDWKTASKLLAPLPSEPEQLARECELDRTAWRELATRHPASAKKELRRTAPALYARLYRNDRDWLLAWKPGAPALQLFPPSRRVDWQERDAEIADRIRVRVAQILRQHPARRASPNQVLGILGLRALLRHRSRLLPTSVNTLNTLCESVDAYQVRRLANLMSAATGKGLSDSQLLWKARINRTRLSDGGAALLALARRKVSEACDES